MQSPQPLIVLSLKRGLELWIFPKCHGNFNANYTICKNVEIFKYK
jgi:hypothetical protein